LESIGEVGSWFCSWVVSSVRKVWKFVASELRAVELVDVVDVVVAVVADVTVVMAYSPQTLISSRTLLGA
jgi:hypothetical protein